MRSYRVTEKTGPVCGMVVAGDDKDVMIINLSGTVIRIHVKDISTTGRVASGVRLMKATEDNPVVSFSTVAMSDEETVKPELEPGGEEGTFEEDIEDGEQAVSGESGAEPGVLEEAGAEPAEAEEQEAGETDQ